MQISNHYGALRAPRMLSVTQGQGFHAAPHLAIISIISVQLRFCVPTYAYVVYLNARAWVGVAYACVCVRALSCMRARACMCASVRAIVRACPTTPIRIVGYLLIAYNFTPIIHS